MITQPSILVGTSERTVLVRVEGKGSFLNSTGLKEFAREMTNRGFREFVVDLKNCPVMDSTFMELIVEKATELGVSTIAPLISERTIVNVDSTDALRKQEKWQRVSIEAAKQCGQNWLPEIQIPRTPKAFFDTKPKFDLMLVASLQQDAQHLKRMIGEFGTKLPTQVLVLVGPEGDFTPAELALAKSAGCRPITLGPIILRTETAAIYCLSVLSHELFG